MSLVFVWWKGKKDAKILGVPFQKITQFPPAKLRLQIIRSYTFSIEFLWFLHMHDDILNLADKCNSGRFFFQIFFSFRVYPLSSFLYLLRRFVHAQQFRSFFESIFMLLCKGFRYLCSRMLVFVQLNLSEP